MYVFDFKSYRKKTWKSVKCVHIIKCVNVRALFAENKVRFTRALMAEPSQN